MTKARVAERIEANADDREAITFLRELIAAQRSGEEAVQTLIAARLLAAGCDVAVRPYDPALVPVIGEFASRRSQTAGMRSNVIGTLQGDPSLRSLMMFAHPDSEPVTDADAWEHDAFAGTIIDGRLYGWGVADDLAGIAAGTLALARAAAPGKPLGTVTMISAPSKRHARGVSAAMHQGLTADGSLYLHPAESGAGLHEIKAFASGQIEFRVTVTGRMPDTTEPGHTAFAHLAQNPIDKAIIVHTALTRLGDERAERIRHPALQAAVGRSTNLMVSNFVCGEDRRFGRLNETCIIGGAVSFPPGETPEEVQAEIAAAVAAAAASDPWLSKNPPEIEWLAGVTGAECPPDHPLYLAAARAVSAATGATPHVNPMHTSSDIRNPIVQKDIPTVGLGGLCGNLSQNGRRDEWVDVADYLRTIAATTAIILDWCGSHRESA